MNAILNLSLEMRLTGLFVVGIVVGSLVNWACYSLAWNPRPISPWSRVPQGAQRRNWADCIPLFGWIFLRRETEIHGNWFWVRPLLVEAACGIGLAWLYWWEIDQFALLPAFARAAAKADPNLVAASHFRFCVHAVLFAVMAAASLIDLDERIIPDTLTVPGTLLGLLVAIFPLSALLPVMTVAQNGAANGPMNGPVVFGFLTAASPNPPPEWFDGAPHWQSLVLGLAAWWLWVFALLPRTWYDRHGTKRALILMWERMRRERITLWLLLLGAAGTGGILVQWLRGHFGWLGLLTGLIGLTVGAVLIWAVRIVGSRALRNEAMGFGDVVLMAMIGVYVGWQSCVVIFFFAVFYALGFAILHYLIRNDKAIPFGPFLCMGAATLIVFWEPVWARFEHAFAMGGFLAAVFAVCVVLMGLMLAGWRRIREAIWGE